MPINTIEIIHSSPNNRSGAGAHVYDARLLPANTHVYYVTDDGSLPIGHQIPCDHVKEVFGASAAIGSYKTFTDKTNPAQMGGDAMRHVRDVVEGRAAALTCE